MKKVFIALSLCLLLTTAKAQEKIDRKALVTRHNVNITKIDTLASLSVGNGTFAFTVDATGLQTFPDYYQAGVPLGTQSEWGWDANPNTEKYTLEETLRDFEQNGRKVSYAVQPKTPERAKDAVEYFRANAHRLQLGNLGFELYKKDGSLGQPSDIKNIKQVLNVWTGEIESTFTFEGTPVKVWTASHQEKDAIGVKVALLFQDAIRGELYRDFADPVGMAGRSLVEGLFGIQPDALKNTLTIQPGLPKSWDHASLEVPDVAFAFKRTNNTDSYQITPHFSTKMNLKLVVNATHENISKVTVNGKEVQWKMIDGTVGSPKISIESPYADSYKIEIVWNNAALEQIANITNICEGENIRITTKNATILEIKDTQNALKNAVVNTNEINALANTVGNKSFFVKLKQKEMIWWQAIDINIKSNLEVVSNAIKGENAEVSIKNNTNKAVNGFLISNQKAKKTKFSLQANSESNIEIPLNQLVSGTNHIEMNFEDGTQAKLSFTNWDIVSNANTKWEAVKLDGFFNDKITNIFENKYLSPRAQSPSLQIPTQGIGNWCYPFIKPVIDDSGLRAKAGTNNQIISPQGVPFSTSSTANKNIAFVSQWDNFPNSLNIPLSGKASQAYLIMAGTTNPMQSQFTNGEIIVTYSDGSSEKLELKNPENWWPIEQDYYIDGYAFTTNAQKPPRVYLKTGTITRDFKDFKSIKGFSDFGVEGGAGTIIDIPLNKNKILKNIEIKAIANEVIIGIMSLTLNRE